jgi:hypothetical protein
MVDQYFVVATPESDGDISTLALGPKVASVASIVTPTPVTATSSRFKHLAYRVTKATRKFFDATVTGTLALSGTVPATGCRCRVKVTSVAGHTDCNGSLAIGSDTLAFTTSGQVKSTTTTATSLPVTTTSNLDCHILIECVDTSGNPIMDETNIELPCKIEIKTKSIPNASGGWTSIQTTAMKARGAFAPLDIIKFDLDNFFDPTNGDAYPIASVRPLRAMQGRESIQIIEF